MCRPLLILALLMLVSASLAAAEYPLVRRGQAEAVILLGSRPTTQDRLAAGELQDYVQRMTGARLAVRSGVGVPVRRGMTRVVLGTLQSSEELSRMVQAGALSLDPEELGAEGFLIETLEWERQPALVLAGGGEVGVVYATYELLERFGRVGFFRHEERVPRVRDLVVPACSIRERPFFPVRMHGGQYHYFGIHWYDEEQWQEELRWFAKHRLNQQNYLPGPPVQYLTDADMWERLGISAPPRSEPRERTAGDALALLRRLSPYARDLGVQAPYYATNGRIPGSVLEEFREKYPEVRSFTHTRGASTEFYVHPADPMWLRLNQEMIESKVGFFGEGKLFYLPSPYAERSPGETPEEQEEITREYAAALGRLATWCEERFPGARWVMDGWAFANHAYWQPYRVERLLQALPPELDLVIWDYPGEDEPSYVYNSYWFGKGWAFVGFHSMAGNTAVHGDVRRLQGEMFRVLCDQRATGLKGMGWYTEARDYAPFWSDYMLRLIRDPFTNLDEFVVDYCERRYSPPSVAAMVRCHELMMRTVYGPQSDTHLKDGFRTVRLQDPVYWFELGGAWVPFDYLQGRLVEQRRHWQPLLAQALAEALSVAQHERDNACYRRDVADLMRSWCQAGINQAVWEMAQAVRQGDREGFEREAARIGRLFDWLLAAISLVSDRWEFGVNALLADFEGAPLRYSPREIRHFLHWVTFGGNTINDYFRADRYELIRDVYRPMTEIYLEECRKLLGSGETALPEVQPRGQVGHQIFEVEALPADLGLPSRRGLWTERYQPLIDRFIAEDTPPPPPVPADAGAMGRAFLAAVQRGEL